MAITYAYAYSFGFVFVPLTVCRQSVVVVMLVVAGESPAMHPYIHRLM